MRTLTSLLVAASIFAMSGISVVAQNAGGKADKLKIQARVSIEPLVEQVNRLKAAGKALGAEAASSCDETHAECEVVIVFDSRRPGSALLARLIADYVALLNQVTEYKGPIESPEDSCLEKSGRTVCNVPLPRPRRVPTHDIAKGK